MRIVYTVAVAAAALTACGDRRVSERDSLPAASDDSVKPCGTDLASCGQRPITEFATGVWRYTSPQNSPEVTVLVGFASDFLQYQVARDNSICRAEIKKRPLVEGDDSRITISLPTWLSTSPASCSTSKEIVPVTLVRRSCSGGDVFDAISHQGLDWGTLSRCGCAAPPPLSQTSGKGPFLQCASR